MSALNNPIVVEISGPNTSGKTHVMAVIQNALEQAGLASSSIAVIGCDNSPESYLEIRKKVAFEGLPDRVKERTVHLVETYGKQNVHRSYEVNLNQEQLTELNGLLKSTHLDLPSFRREVRSCGTNYEWLQRNILKRNQPSPRLKQLLGIKAPENTLPPTEIEGG